MNRLSKLIGKLTGMTPEEIMKKDFADADIDKELWMKHSGRYICDDVRLATGRFYTKKEYEERRKKILSTPLP